MSDLETGDYPENNPGLQKFCEDVSRIIGGNITPQRVQSVIEAANEGRHIVHGVKWKKDIPKIRQEGVAPLTPEGGNVSFWTSGTRIFGDTTENGLSTYDSTFFHYAHSTETPGAEDSGVTTMAMALTNPRFFKRDLPEDDYITIDAPVPPDAICFLRVEVIKGKTNYEPRKCSNLAEQKMFELLENALINGYQPGEEKTVTINLDRLPESNEQSAA